MKFRHLILISVIGLFLMNSAHARYLQMMRQYSYVGTQPTAIQTIHAAPIANTSQINTPRPSMQPVAQFQSKSQIVHQSQYADGMNLYQYVRSNPINLIDPYGLWSYPWGGLRWDMNSCNCKRFSTRRQRRTLACTMRSASNSCTAVDQYITDPDLATCIKRKCEKTKIKCSTATPKGIGGNSAGWGSIAIFPNNYNTDGSWGRYTSGDVVIHEFAEKCGWKHGQGKGVPDPLTDLGQNGQSSWGIKCQ